MSYNNNKGAKVVDLAGDDSKVHVTDIARWHVRQAGVLDRSFEPQIAH